MMHRDLANDQHKTNVHMHYHVPYYISVDSDYMSASGSPIGTRTPEVPEPSFFNATPQSSEPFLPLDSKVHRPLDILSFLNRKLRWLTLGGQYDWTRKQYPNTKPPSFPPDIAELIQRIDPSMEPEAAIVNIYSAGDTLSLHRDVSEDSKQGLISISLGCDGIFIIGLENKTGLDRLAIRLHSGDVIWMKGRSRFAWHGVPQIIPATCPQYLQDWPCRLSRTDGPEKYQAWQGWMASKRINLNVRQMR